MKRESWWVTVAASRVLTLISLILAVAALIVAIVELRNTQDQMSESIAASEAAAFSDMMKAFYDAKNLYYDNAARVTNLSNGQDDTLPRIMLSNAGQDFSNVINFACALLQDGRLGEYGKDFMDQVVEEEAKFYRKFRLNHSGYYVNLSMCNWEWLKPKPIH